MKKIYCLLACYLLTLQLFAQAPQRLSFQAIIRNANNVLVTNAPIKMRISILQGSITGTAVYTELHSATTNANGVAFVEVGGGTSPTGNFSTIKWGQGPFFLRSETDPNNGTNYTVVGTTQLLSVPYALQSNRAARADSSTHAVKSDSAARAGNGLPPTSIHGELRLYQCNGKVQYTPCLPLVVTTPLSGITGFGAASGGNVTSEGGVPVTARGVVWSTAVNPTIALTTRTSNGTGAGSYTSSLTNLTPNTLYYVRAYATNSAGTAYGNELSFRTGRLPVVTTNTISAITATTANGGGNVSDSGTASVTARGIVWSTLQNPTIEFSARTNNGTGIGSFTSSIIRLSPDSTYFVRAYATSSVGTAYGPQVSFRALRLPVVTTTTISAITATTATGGGNVTDSGSVRVTARGIVWSTSPNPTIALTTRTNNGAGIGSFTSSLTGLVPDSVYYVRAYATSSAGTVYGAELSFRTPPLTIPVVSTNPVYSITDTGAISGGNISNNGGATITARGVVWSTSSSPTINLTTLTSDGTGNGAFASTLSSLAPGTLYYVRAYATNSVGTGYGNEQRFTTLRPAASLTVLACSTATHIGTLNAGIVASGVNSVVAYTGGNGGTYAAQTISSTGVTGLTATLAAGRLANGNGTLTFTITGTPSTSGTASFAISIGGQSCTLSRTVNAPLPGFPAGTVICGTAPTAIVEVANPATGRFWMDRNLGASRAATSSTDAAAFGDLYQWGRRADGHQCRNSPTTRVLSSTDQSADGNFILSSAMPYDWRIPQNNNLWQGVYGINNPCPGGFRLPTDFELDQERQSWSTVNAAGAFGSALKWTISAYRHGNNNTLDGLNIYGNYWSSTISSIGSNYLYIDNTNTNTKINMGYRASGMSVRCIKD